MITKVLFICGIFAPLLYVGTDIFAAMSYEGYRYIHQSISELSAIEAPTRPLWIAMTLLYNSLLIAFGIGVWIVAGRERSLGVTAILLGVYGVIGVVWALLAPMHMRGTEFSATDAMHIVFTIVSVILMLLFIGFGSTARGKWFRLYSILTILVILVFGAWAGTQGPQLAAGLPTPWLGVIERISVYSSMLWVLVLAIVLLRTRKDGKLGLVLGQDSSLRPSG